MEKGYDPLKSSNLLYCSIRLCRRELQALLKILSAKKNLLPSFQQEVLGDRSPDVLGAVDEQIEAHGQAQNSYRCKENLDASDREDSYCNCSREHNGPRQRS